MSWALLFLLFLFGNSGRLNAQDTLEAKDFRAYMLEFLQLEEKDPGPTDFSLQYRIPGNGEGHIVVACYLRSQSLGCVPTIVKLFSDYKNGKQGSYRGKLTFVIANPLELLESNRDKEGQLKISQLLQHQDRDRIEAIKQSIRKADLLIEIFPELNEHSQNYYAFSFDQLSYELSKYLRFSETLVLSAEEEESALAAHARRFDVRSIALHLNQKELSEAEALAAYQKSRQAIEFAMQVKARNLLTKVADIKILTETLPELKEIYTIKQREDFEPSKKLDQNFHEFQNVKASEVLGRDKSETEIKAFFDGKIINVKNLTRDAAGLALPPFPRYLFKVIEPIELKKLLP